MAEPLLVARGLGLALPDRAARRGFGRTPSRTLLEGIDLAIQPGERVGLVGESGSGKTTLGRTLLRLYRPTAGALAFEGRDITHLPEPALRPLRARMQMVFQDPSSSLNPRHRIEDLLAQPLLAFDRVASRAAGRDAARTLLARVHLPDALATRFPHELSGGQRQRVGIARALALDPRLIVADEIVSGLDASSQARILQLLRESTRDNALLFISHDLPVVRVLCDRVVVLLHGRIVEQGPVAQVFDAPSHPYTRTLLDAIPTPVVDPRWLDAVPAEA